jgi:hypothetical protein
VWAEGRFILDGPIGVVMRCSLALRAFLKSTTRAPAFESSELSLSPSEGLNIRRSECCTNMEAVLFPTGVEFLIDAAV